MIALSDRAFVAQFEEIDRWDPGSFLGIEWHWPSEVMRPLGSVLQMRKEKVNRKQRAFVDLQPVTIHFDGSMDKRKVDASREYTMDLYSARPGDIVVAKIDLKNGAVGIVPDDWEDVVVTGHFAVYEPDLTQLLPAYFHLIIQSPFFKAYLWRNKVGAEGRKEVKLDFFENVPIPLPSLPVQQSIVNHWQQAQDDARVLWMLARQSDDEAASGLLRELGLQIGEARERSKAMAVQWGDLFQWSGRATFLLSQNGGMSDSSYPMVSGRECIAEVRHGCGASPSPEPTPLNVLKISAVTRGTFAPSERKYMYDKPEYRRLFDLKPGDILMCRTNGTLAYVGMASLVTEQDDIENLIFPDKIMRVRAKPNALPSYLAYVLKSPHLRTQIEAAARTAVGNYAIGTDDIWNLQIPLPPREAQENIVRRVQELRAESVQYRQRADSVRAQAKVKVESMILGASQP